MIHTQDTQNNSSTDIRGKISAGTQCSRVIDDPKLTSNAPWALQSVFQ
jgi:hypothetical protein